MSIYKINMADYSMSKVTGTIINKTVMTNGYPQGPIPIQPYHHVLVLVWMVLLMMGCEFVDRHVFYFIFKIIDLSKFAPDFIL